MYGMDTEDVSTALAAALSYWVFRCRDRGKSPAMGLKTWEFFQSSIQNAAIPSRSIEMYIEGMARKLIVPHLNPREWMRIISPIQTTSRIKVTPIVGLDDGPVVNAFDWLGWEEILASLRSQGISDRHILNKCRTAPHIITALCRVRFEYDKELNAPEIVETVDIYV